MRKKRREKSEGDKNSWMVTFTNLVILLLAFFIVMVNMGVPDSTKKRQALNSLFGSFGFKPGGQAVIGSPSGTDITVSDAPMIKEDADLSKLQNIAVSNGLGSDMLLKKEAEKIVIILSNRVLFDKGSARMLEDGFGLLADLSHVLKLGPGLIELRGYADYAEALFEPDPQVASMYLSTKRALTVLHYLVDKGKIPTHRVVAHGFGIPSKEKEDFKGKRRWQRQVEIIVDYKQKIPYRMRSSKKWNRSLDFKGFLFRFLDHHSEKS